MDYEKAFDRVDWTKLMEILCNIGVDYMDRKLMESIQRAFSELQMVIQQHVKLVGV